MTDIVDRLKAYAEINESFGTYTEAKCALDAAEEIKRLREKCDKQAKILQSLTPEMYPGVLFIHAQLGERDQNNMPEKLLVVPSYGVDWSQVYVRTEKTEGPKW